MLHIVLVLVPRCKCLFVHTHRINFQANERCLWCSVIKMTSILHSIPFYSILFYSFRSCSLYYCLLTVYKYVVKGFNNYWCVHLLTWVLFVESASIEHCHDKWWLLERIESERISCGSFDVSIYMFGNAHWSFGFVNPNARTSQFVSEPMSPSSSLQSNSSQNSNWPNCMRRCWQYFETQLVALIKSETVKCNLLVGPCYQNGEIWTTIQTPQIFAMHRTWIGFRRISFTVSLRLCFVRLKVRLSIYLFVSAIVPHRMRW